VSRIFPRLAASLLAACLLACGGAPASSPPADPFETAVPAARLPVVGTVGDLPAPERRVTIALLADGTIVTRDGPVDYEDLRAFLRRVALPPERSEHAADELPNPSPPSRSQALIRADAGLPWAVLAWTLAACTETGVDLREVFYAVRPEDGGAEGGLAHFFPGRVLGCPVVEVPTVSVRLHGRLQIASDSLFVDVGARLREVEGETVVLGAEADRAAGTVLRAIDLCHRAGAASVQLVGVPFPPSATEPRLGRTRTWIQGYVATHPAVAGAGVEVDGAPSVREPFAAGAEPPAVGRVFGRIAGPTLADFVPVDPTPEEAAAAPGDGVAVAVTSALEWLVAHQSPDGGWEAKTFDRWCAGKPNPTPRRGVAKPDARDVAVTGLALCAFLAAGHTNRDAGSFGKAVTNGVRFLKGAQDTHGCFAAIANERLVLDHTIATLALTELHRRTGNPIHGNPARKGLEFLASARDDEGWRQGIEPGGDDATVAAWAGLAFRAASRTNREAEAAGRSAPFEYATEACAAFLAGADPTAEAATARQAALLSATLAQADESPTPHDAELLAARPPLWDAAEGTGDATYWLFGALATSALGGEPAKTWRDTLSAALLPHQRRDGDACDEFGSWDPADAPGVEGSRVHSTAICVLALLADRLWGPRVTPK
jgi:hypothetical protein